MQSGPWDAIDTSRRHCCLAGLALLGGAATPLGGLLAQGHQPPAHPHCQPPAGYTPVQAGWRVINTVGDARSDAAFRAEFLQQQNFWNQAAPGGVPTALYVIDEGAPQKANAYASPYGWIGFGYYFFHQHLRAHGQLAIEGTLGHEFGHRVQQAIGRWRRSPAPFDELEADAFGAYYLALFKRHQWSTIQGYIDHVVGLGDTNFNSPLHHGTAQQRYAASDLGATLGLQSAQRGTFPTAAQMHQYFAYNINRMLGRA